MENKHQDIFTQIGLNILYYRKSLGLTQMQLAERCSYSRNHIQQIETAKVIPSIVALIDISNALEINITKLFEFR